MHDLPLITTIAAAFTAAWLLGLLTQWLRLSPIVGYLLAGILIGPYTPGFVGDVHLAAQLAEMGVILLMFGVGLHFHLKDLLAVKGVAIPGAIGQSLMATLAAIALFALFGVPVKTGAVIGMALAVASTVVLMRVLMDADALNSTPGHVAVGWLIVEDILTVVLLVLIPVLGTPLAGSSGGSFWQTLGLALLKLTALVAIVMLGGSRLMPWLLVKVARLRSRELFTLTVLVFSIAVAAAAYYFFGASMALGAFLAGMVVAQSPVSHQVAADALPMRDAFAVLFFVSVGMIFDPSFLIREPLMIAAALGIILLVKPLAALGIVALLGYPARTALTVAIGLGQIGEFSFILSDLARRHKLMTDDGHNVLVAAAIVSITLNPLLFRNLPKMEAWLRRKPRLWKLINGRAERRVAAMNRPALQQVEAAGKDRHLAVVIGYGPVGRSVHRVLRDAGLSTVVVDMNMDTVSELNAAGQAAIYGDATNESILEQAGIRQASHLVLTLPQSSQSVVIVTAARNLNAGLRILVRARYLKEREELERSGASAAVFEEAEAAVALSRIVLADTGLHSEAAENRIRDLRLHLITENLSNLHGQRVGSVMVPWTRIKSLPAGADRAAVLARVSRERFSRWPVVDDTGRATGYLLTKDLLLLAAEDDWLRIVRPLPAIRAEESIETALSRMQSENASIYVVEDADRQAGLITQEDILEQVVGRLEDEYPHEQPVTLAEAVERGGVHPSLTASSREEVIRELAAALPASELPPGMSRDDIAARVLARENEISTDLGNGVAVPHARCAKLRTPVALLGRSPGGVLFSAGSGEPVRLFFLILTPEDNPEAQLTLLAQIVRLVRKSEQRAALLHAASPADVLDLLHKDQARTVA